MKIEFNFSSPKIHASISRNARIYEKNIIFSKKQMFQEKIEFLKEDGIFSNRIFFLAFSNIEP